MILAYKGIDIFYKDAGKGPVVVLLHGFLENSNMWNPFLPELTKKNRVVCIDLLGHGKTGCLGYVHAMELMAETVQAVLNHLKIEKSIFIGHSMGAYVALAFAEAYPNAIRGLFLINSTAEEDSEEKKENRERAILAVKHNYKTFIRIAINNLFTAQNSIFFKKEINQTIKEALKTPLQGIIAALEGMKIRPNRESVLRKNNFKTMFIISKNDPIIDYNNLIRQAKKANAQIVEFPDGHMSYIENKSELTHEMMYFIEF